MIHPLDSVDCMSSQYLIELLILLEAGQMNVNMAHVYWHVTLWMAKALAVPAWEPNTLWLSPEQTGLVCNCISSYCFHQILLFGFVDSKIALRHRVFLHLFHPMFLRSAKLFYQKMFFFVQPQIYDTIKSVCCIHIRLKPIIFIILLFKLNKKEFWYVNYIHMYYDDRCLHHVIVELVQDMYHSYLDFLSGWHDLKNSWRALILFLKKIMLLCQMKKVIPQNFL